MMTASLLWVAVAVPPGAAQLRVTQVAGPMLLRLSHGASHDVAIAEEDTSVVLGAETTAVEVGVAEPLLIGAAFTVAYGNGIVVTPEIRAALAPSINDRMRLLFRAGLGRSSDAVFDGTALLPSATIGAVFGAADFLGKRAQAGFVAELTVSRARYEKTVFEIAGDDAAHVTRWREAWAITFSIGGAATTR